VPPDGGGQGLNFSGPGAVADAHLMLRGQSGHGSGALLGCSFSGPLLAQSGWAASSAASWPHLRTAVRSGRVAGQQMSHTIKLDADTSWGRYMKSAAIFGRRLGGRVG